jgi:hypothetical protein
MRTGSIYLVLTVGLLAVAGWAEEASVEAKVDSTSAKTSTVENAATNQPSLTAQQFSSSKALQPEQVPFLRANLDLLPPISPEPLAINPVVQPISPVQPKLSEKESARNKKIWYSLTLVNHGAATFDAWSTREAIGRGAKEVNPLMKPFANSNAMYAAVQVVPFGMDYLGRRMMRSNNRVVRKLWWVPQTASAACSLAAGIHNMGVNTR